MTLYSISKHFIFRLSLSLLIGISCWQCHTQEPSPTSTTLLAIAFDNVNILSTTTDPATNVWTIKVPYLTNLRQVKPTLTLLEGSTVVPRSGEVQDFTKTVLYTVTASTGAKTVYQILVKADGQPTPQVTASSVDTLEAGQSLQLTGHNFGTFGLDVSVVATGPTNQTTVLTSTLLDSTRVRADLPFTLLPGRYSLIVLVRNLRSLTSASIQVRYPSPQLTQVDRHYIRTGDTLRVNGLYIKPDAYQYALQISNGQQAQLAQAILPQSDGFAVRVEPTLPAGRYRVQVVNRSENKVSRDTSFSIQLYERAKPFVTDIITPKTAYTVGETVLLRTANFDTVPARFYQLQLSGSSRSYTVNGIYDATRQQLALTLPTTAIKGTYALNARLLDTTGQIVYSFDTDLQLSFP